MGKFDTVYNKYQNNEVLSIDDKEIILLDLLYFLEDENRHAQIELIEELTGYNTIQLAEKHGNIE